MENFLVCLNAVTPIFLLMALGYAVKCLGYLNREDVAKLNKLLYRVFMPVLMFQNVYKSDLGRAFRPWLLLYAVAAVLTAFFLGILFARLVSSDRRQRGVLVQVVYRSNFVIIGMPIAQSLMGDADMGPVAILLAVVVPLYNVLAVIILEYYNGDRPDARKLLRDILKNPLILGTLAAILLRLLPFRLPAAILNVTGQMSQTASAFLLVLLGAFFRFDGMRSRLKTLLPACAVRLLVIPGLFLNLAAALGFRGVELAGMLGIFASAMAATSFPMSQQMGGDAELAGNCVVLTSVLCPFTLFLWCLLFKNSGWL